MTDEVRNVIIIGSGPAGYTAGLYSARALLEPLMFAGYMSGGQLMLTSDIENLGAKFHSNINFDKKNEFYVNSDTVKSKIKNFIGYFLHGVKLKSYEFNLYKSKKTKKVISINVTCCNIFNKSRVHPGIS